jgi:hypothetical protein
MTIMMMMMMMMMMIIADLICMEQPETKISFVVIHSVLYSYNQLHSPINAHNKI